MKYVDEIYVNRIIQGGIYFLTLEDDKTRPYVVISKNSGYGVNVILFVVTSKCPLSDYMLPVVIGGKVSFIRTSGTKEVSPKMIIDSDFGGVIRPDILSLAIPFYASRFMNLKESDVDRLEKDNDRYLHDIQEKRYPLYMNAGLTFNVKDFLKNKYSEHPDATIVRSATQERPVQQGASLLDVDHGTLKRKYPLDLNEWSLNDLKMFRSDMFRLTEKELITKYGCSANRIQYIKRNIKYVIKKKRGVRV